MNGSLWRHLKTGHLYVIVGECRIEATMEPAYLYARVDEKTRAKEFGAPWARPKDEFLDGHFEALKGESSLSLPRNDALNPPGAADQ